MKTILTKLLFLLVITTLTSCVTTKKLTYLRNDEPSLTDTTIVSVTPADYKVQPYDNLFIRVVTPDPQWSAMFNTMSVASGSNDTELGADLISYAVDSSGAIKLPYAGQVMVAGKTLAQISESVILILQGYIADPAVTVKMINNYVSLIGEVRMPGRYAIYKDRLNIFQALAMGGDLGDYSDRQKVQVIRQTPDGNMVKEFSLNDRTIMSSEFFYVMPNDVIYAKPMKGKFFQMNAFPYSIILGTFTAFILLLNVVNN